MQRRYTVFWMILHGNFLVLVAVEAIENDNMQAHAGRRCVRQGERGRLDYGQGRGGDGLVVAVNMKFHN